MEPADVAQVVFELSRTKLDRVMMEYEDRLSADMRHAEKMRAEGEELRCENLRLKRLYEKARAILLQSVGKFAQAKDATPESLPPLLKEALSGASGGSRARRSSLQTPPAKGFMSPIELMPATSPSRSPGTGSESTALPSPVGSPALGYVEPAFSPPPSLKVPPIKQTPVDARARKRGRPITSTTSDSPRRPSRASPTFVYEDVVRNKEQRAVMDGYECTECRKWHDVLRQQGLVASSQEAREHKRKCCRHKHAHEPPGTPEGFWDLTVPDYTQAKENEVRENASRQAQKQKPKHKAKQPVLRNKTNQGKGVRPTRL